MADKARSTPVRAFAAFTVAMLLVMMFPIYGLANSVEPIILGMPFSLAWVVFWIIVEFIALIAFYVYEFKA